MNQEGIETARHSRELFIKFDVVFPSPNNSLVKCQVRIMKVAHMERGVGAFGPYVIVENIY